MSKFYICGNNCFNQINKTNTTKIVNVELLSVNDVISVSLSWSRIVCLTEQGRVIITGFTSDGNTNYMQLESPSGIDDSFTHINTGWKVTFLGTKAGKWFILIDGERRLKPIQFLLSESNKDVSVVRVFTGEMHTLILNEAGQLYSAQIPTECIHGERFPLNLDPINLATKISDVICGKEHVLIQTDLKTICSFGLGSRGQLGHGGTESETNPRVIEALEGLKIHHVAAGGWHSMALSDIGDVYVWGWNESGQLGLPTANSHQFVKRSSNNDKDEQHIKRPFTTPAEDLLTSKKENNRIMFKAEPTILDFPYNSVIVKISCGSRHSAAVTENGQLYTWGWNEYGQLGLQHTDIKEQPTFVKHEKNYIQDVICSYWNTVILVK